MPKKKNVKIFLKTRPSSYGKKRSFSMGRWIRRIFLGCGLILVLSAIGGSLYQFIATSRDSRAYPPPGQIVEVEGHSMHYLSRGEGTPTVILESGCFGFCLDWSLVQKKISKYTHVISYDRSGYGWSEPVSSSHSAKAVNADLHALLQAAQIPGPYLLVGHSLGGLYSRHFAATYPNEVVGMVLVDPTPDTLASIPALAEERKRVDRIARWVIPSVRGAAPLGFMRLLRIPAILIEFPDTLDPLQPDTIKPALDARGYRTSSYLTAIDEWNSMKGIMEEVRIATALQPKPDWPLIILSQGRLLEELKGTPESTDYKTVEALHQYHRQLTRLSYNSIHLTAKTSKHFIQVDQPDSVIEAILAAVESIREYNMEDIGEYIHYDNNIVPTNTIHTIQGEIKP